MTDLFAKDNEVQANYWKLTNIGDSIQGTLVEKKITVNNLRVPACKQTIYTIIQDDETPIKVGGRGNQDPQVIAGLEACKMGQYVGVKYVEDRESAKPGMNAAKIIRVYTNGKMNQDVLNKYNGVSANMESPF